MTLKGSTVSGFPYNRILFDIDMCDQEEQTLLDRRCENQVDIKDFINKL